jgi:DEAD/DEAH box helicase domain-containing protein
MRISSEQLLAAKGYSYVKYTEQGSIPEYVDVTFKDILPEFSSLEIGNCRLYKHQYQAYIELSRGLNVVLRAGTGSGKTEAWVLYFLDATKKLKDYHAIVLYPTLALANDQIKRLEKYISAVGKKAVQLDSVKKEEYLKSSHIVALKSTIASSELIITNPAFLLHDLKKYFVRKESAVMAPIYSKLDLLVIDEIDFYSPRSLALLLSMIMLLSKITEKQLQVVVLSAGISNPEELCGFLEKITNRKCSVVEGEPFRVENHVYIVLGKNLEDVWSRVKTLWRDFSSKYKELAQYSRIIEDFDEFKKNAFYVISLLESLGADVPSLSLDPVEIIGSYLLDEYVTVVFTRSINTAEELVRAVKTRYGEDAPIASHHHLIPKRIRESIEESARAGKLKVIVSPRTLSQGIDIGLVARVVHLGLPDNVREFYQREGRKGRRAELGYSETIIIPYSRWDRELLSQGVELFRSWLSLGLEKTLINQDNLYIYLLSGVLKLVSPWFRELLIDAEKRALESTGVISREGSVNQRLLRELYEKINFYEYAPPYGIKRYLEKDGDLIPLEPIGHCDLVEKFQPGCIDYAEEAIVISLNYGKSTRYVRSVIEKPIRDIDFKSHDALAVALEEYRYIKMNWGEKPQFLRDLLAGRITSEELCVVYTPRSGFGKYIKIPERCIWTIRSERPRFLLVRGKPIVYYDKKTIYVPMPTGGEYRDFTYGYTYSTDPRENAELMRLALAYLIVLLRRLKGIPLGVIMYDVTKIGENKYITLYEPEAAGIIEKIDWLEIRKLAEKYTPDELDRILISEVDDLAYSTLVTIDFNWDVVREQAIRVVDYILARDKLRVLLSGEEVYIPRPSPALKVLSYTIISEILGEEEAAPSLMVFHGYFDGSDFQGAGELYPPVPLLKPPRSLLEVEESVLNKLFYEDFKLLVESREATLLQLKRANLKRLVSFIESRGDEIIDVSELLSRAGFQYASVDDLAIQAGLEVQVNHAKVRELIKQVELTREITSKAREALLRYLEFKSRAIYIAYLVLTELSKKRS